MNLVLNVKYKDAKTKIKTNIEMLRYPTPKNGIFIKSPHKSSHSFSVMSFKDPKTEFQLIVPKNPPEIINNHHVFWLLLVTKVI